MTSPFGPFGSQIERLGDLLINKVSDEIFGDGDAARLTRVMIYNHTSQDLFFLDSSFESGGFSAGMQPDKIEADAIGGYRVESHGLASGVTGADVSFGLSPTGQRGRRPDRTLEPLGRQRQSVRRRRFRGFMSDGKAMLGQLLAGVRNAGRVELPEDLIDTGYRSHIEETHPVRTSHQVGPIIPRTRSPHTDPVGTVRLGHPRDPAQ